MTGPRGGTTSLGGGAAVSGPVGVIVLKLFDTTDTGSVYFWQGAELEVTGIDDPSWHAMITSAGEAPGFVPFVAVPPGSYEVRAGRGRITRWNGASFSETADEVPSTTNRVGVKENEVVGFGNAIAPGVTLLDTWAEEVPGGDRWFCNYNQLGCYCTWTKPGEDSWLVCPPIQYACCWESADGSECSCPDTSYSSPQACEMSASRAGGKVVPSCPAGEVPAGVGVPLPTAPEACNSIENVGAAVEETATEADAPVPMGGEIAPGTYALTAVKRYGCGVACAEFTERAPATYVFTRKDETSGHLELIDAPTGRLNAEYSTDGVNLEIRVQCPAELAERDPFVGRYTATPGELVLFGEETDTGTRVQTFTLQ